MDFINPSAITAPASNYSQGVVVPAGARRLVISGQIGMTKEGKVLDGISPHKHEDKCSIGQILFYLQL